MKIDSGKLFVAGCVLCVVLTSGSCFHKHIQTLTVKVRELFGGKTRCPEERDAPPDRRAAHDRAAAGVASPQQQPCNDSDNGDRPRSFGIDWSRVGAEAANNWWIVALSSLLPLMVFWRVQYKMRKRLQEWRRLFVQKEKAHNYSRRMTLPDLTLAKHARRESLAEATFKPTGHPRKLSQSNGGLQLRNTKQNLFERNDDAQGEIKRAHKIRRRH